MNLYSKEIYYSGEINHCPKALSLDFAFSIHSEIGLEPEERVNGKWFL
jgi:(p)ppGpp synthase/HD superfamily hydrolase